MNSRKEEIDALRRRLAVLEGRLPPEAQLSLAPASAASKLQEPALPSDQNATAFQDRSIKDDAGTPRLRSAVSARFCLGVEALDGASAQPGFKLGTVHEFIAPQVRLSGALTGFVAALATLCANQRAGQVLWALDEAVQREAGMLCAQGFLQFGLDPARLIMVTPRRVEDMLWALEEGSQCQSLSVVVGEMLGDFKELDLTSTRRLVLRAERSGVPLFFMRHGADAAVSAAMTRWCVGPGPMPPATRDRAGAYVPHRALMGAPRWRVTLEKNREGRPDSCDLEWNHATRQFDEIPRLDTENASAGTATDSLSLVSRVGHRSPVPSGAGQVVAFRRAR